jgi:hypothetical protein
MERVLLYQDEAGETMVADMDDLSQVSAGSEGQIYEASGEFVVVNLDGEAVLAQVDEEEDADEEA